MKKDWTSDPVPKSEPTNVLVKVWDTLTHIKEHTAAMALSLERIEEMVAEERAWRKSYHDTASDPMDDIQDYESPA